MTPTPSHAHRNAARTVATAAPSRSTGGIDGTASSLAASEAYSVLLSLAQRRTLHIPAEYLVRYVLTLHAETDWPVRRAALEAVLRRVASARREDLRVEKRPPKGEVRGLYRTRRRNGTSRPYRTLLRGLEPLDASCDCPDFLKSSLGLCKHVVCVLDELGARPGRFERARQLAARPPAPPILRWDPVRPLLGAGDWLSRVELRPNGEGSRRGGAAPGALRASFAPGPEGALHPRSVVLARPAERLQLLSSLRELGASGAPWGPSDPALDALLRDEEKRVTARLELAGVGARALRGLRRELYAYQREGLERFLASGRLLLADDMGLGKTVQAVAAAHALFRAGRIRRGLFIVPASLKSQWQREWLETTDLPVAIVEGPPPERRRIYRNTASGFLIANYEQLWRDLDWVVGWQPELVVLDEAQRIKNWATKTADYVKRLDPPYRLVLTGTPMENRLSELASIMEWVDEQALEPTWRLVPWHSLTADGATQVVGARNLATLRERLAPSMLRRLRREVLSQLPPRTDTRVPVQMTASQQEEHDALYPPIAKLAHVARRRPLTQAEFLRLMSLLTTQRIIANGMAQLRVAEVWPGLSGVSDPDDALLESLGSPKLVELRPIVSNLVVEQGRKLVVFSQWRRMLRLAAWCVEPILREAGLRAAFFTGEESLKRRTQNLVDLHDDPRTCVLFATDAGGVGVNLQRAASACVNLDLPWNPAVLEQRIGRIHRIGQRKPIDVFHLVSQGSIEERIAILVSDKKAVFSGLFDGVNDQVRFERSGNFFTGIESLLEGVQVPEQVTETVAGDDGEESDLPGSDSSELDAADDIVDVAPARADGAAPMAAVDARSVEALFRSLEIQATPSGGIRIEAPPEAAATLGALLRGLAGLLERR